MAEPALSTLSEPIKKAVQNPLNCSADTVTALQRLLSGSHPTHERLKEVKSTKRSVKVTRTQSQTKSAKPRTAAKVPIFQTQTENDVRILSRQEKLVLATEIFNIASKSLSECIKLQQSPHPVYNSTKSKNTVGAETPSKKPLQLTSPNQKIQSPIKSKETAKQLLQRKNERPGATEIVECARLALFTLRELRAPEDGQGKPNIQLEQGLCILIGKLLAAGLHEMAINDLWVLKASIQTAIEAERVEPQDKRSSKPPRSVEHRNSSLADLIKFTSVPQTGALLQLCISFQFHALKAIAAERNPSTVDEVFDVLKLANSSSAANSILAGYKNGVILPEKAAQQLQFLSQNILSLSFACPTTDSKSTSKSRVGGAKTLCLQILSFEIRYLWWGISGHKCDEAKELWEPLARYFRTFARRCPAIRKSDFEGIKEPFLQLKRRVESNGRKSGDNGLRSSSMSDIMKTLSQLAYSAGCLENAAEFCEFSVASLTVAQSVQRAICQCRRALLQVETLQSSTSSISKVTASIDDAAENLTASLKGNQKELDELLVESAKLKKTIMKSLSGLTSSQSEEDSGKPALSSLRHSAIGYMISFIRFLNRYVTIASASDTSKDSEDSPDQTPHKCEKIAIAAVDSAVALAKLPMGTKTSTWEIFEPLLSDCFALCKHLNRDNISESASHISSRFLRLSNLYWSYYIAQRDFGKQPCDLLPLVELSINTLKCCSFSERVSGFMAIKLERLAILCFDIGQTNKAEITYVAAIQAHIEAGVLSSASDQSASKHPRHIWKDSRSPTFALGRVLGYYVKHRLKLGCKLDMILYDNKDLELNERATLLELQTTIIMDTVSSDPKYATSTLLPSIIPRLLAMYPLNTYPVRRSRVILQTLQFLLDSNGSVGHDFSDLIVSEANKCLLSTKLSKDKGLKLVREDILASLRLTIGFYLGHIPAEDIERVVQTWVTAVQSCETWSSIEFRVEDAQGWVSQIKGLIDYLEVRGLWKFRICAISVLNQVLSLQEKRDFSMMVTCSRMMGLQYSRLGYSEKAGSVLAKAKAIVEQNDVGPHALLSWHLAFAEFFLEVGNYEKSTNSVLAAQSIYETASINVSKESFRTRTMFERLAVDASLLLSRIFFAKGAINEAVFYAKRAVKSSSRLWARLEKYISDKSGKMTPGNDDSTDTLTDKIAELDLSSDGHNTGMSYLEGSIYWPHFASHCAALLQLSRVSGHNGFFQDAIYHKEQALTTSEAMGANSLVPFIRAELGSCWLLGGQFQKGKELLEMARDELDESDESINSLSLTAHLATLYSYDDEPEEAYHTLGNSCQALSTLSRSSVVNSLDPFSGSEIEIKMKDLSIGTSSKSGPSETGRPLRSRSVKRPQRPNTRLRSEKSIATPPESNTRLSLLSQLNGRLLRQQTSLLISSQSLSDAAVLLDEAERLPKSEMDQVNHRICKTQYLLAKSFQKLATHSVYCVIPESTISLPSINVNEKPLKERPAPSSTRNTRALTSTKRIKPLALSPKKKALQHEQDFSEFLSIAKQSLTDLPSSATLYGSSRDGHQVSYLLNRISMLSFTTGSAQGATPDPIQATSVLELGRNSAIIRERYSILADKELSGHMKRLEWPGAPKAHLDSSLADHSDFMKDYVNILPEDWDVISVTLSPNHDEFIISKLRRGQLPFILCLPLKRGGDDDMDEETFDFDEGKEELLEVIRLANESAHNTQARFNKKAKKQWWTNREALDERLKDLLHNMEAVWLGGFRGIFSQKPRNDAVISKFIDCFQKILDKHLPSRRRKRGKARNIYPGFDQRVMELFLNIGSLDDANNPEESVIDLLYFIVDILQFHGERNAYDEIDFDMMVVETLDALRTYDEAERREQNPTPPRHTILVLDKALHSFPWESLDCLENSSVSRMPSLHSVRERLLQLRSEDMAIDGSTGVYINQNSGSYILNPGGDLKSTQTVFEGSLSNLKDWTSIVQRDPTEEDFEKALATKDLLLYFGHGSGAQYIRGRTIRRLDRCAVTFLMGCSSGSMVETGEFEPYGTPWNYMHAGAPALVATLWDVTDKDIDRFAKSSFEEWGLLPHTKSSNGGGDDRPSSMDSPGEVGLDAAVAKSRSACILRYLNGAAPVVYGVPVFLK